MEQENQTPIVVKKRRWPKFLLKTFAWIIGLLLTILVSLVLIAEYAEDDVVQLVMPSVEETINAPIKIGKVSLSFIHSFPYTTLKIEDVYLGSSKNNTKTDSLVKVSNLYISVETEPLLDGIINVTEVEFSNATIKYLVEKDGSTCFDFLMPTDTVEEEPVDTTTTSLNIDLRKITIENITAIYDDRSLGAKAVVNIPKIIAKGRMNDSVIQAAVKGNVVLKSVDYDSTNVNRLRKGELNIDVDYANNGVELNNIALAIDDILINATGTVNLDSLMMADLTIESNEIIIDSLMKFLPDGMLSEFGVNRVSGALAFNATAKGNLLDTTQYPHVEATVSFSNGLADVVDVPLVSNLNLAANITTGDKNTDETIAVDITKLHLNLPHSAIDFTASVKNLNQIGYKANGNIALSIEDIKSFIPNDLGISKIYGDVKLKLATRGTFYGDVDNKFIERALHNTSADVNIIDFGVTMDSVIVLDTLNGKINYTNYNVTIDELGMSLPEYQIKLSNTALAMQILGDIFDMDKLGIDLSKMHTEIGNSKFDVTANLINCNIPTFKATLGANVDINDFWAFIPDSLINSINGGVSANVSTFGTINLETMSDAEINSIIGNTSVNVNLNNLTADMFDPFLSFSNLNGKIDFATDLLQVNKMGINWKGINLSVDSLTVENLVKIFVEEKAGEKILVEGKFDVDEFDYALIDELFPTDTTAVEEPEQLAETETIAEDETPIPSYVAKGKFSLGKLIYGKSTFTDINGLFNVSDTVYIVDQLKLNAFNGKINASVRAKMLPDDKIETYFKAKVDSMDLNQILVEFDNFDQTDITNENLSGLLSTDINGYVYLLDMGDSIPMDKIRFMGDFRLDDGNIKDLEMLKGIAKFTNLRDLNNIQFQTLKTSVFMYHDAVYLPQTDIKSTTMNVSAFGMQEMTSGDFGYHIKIFPGEILRGKSKKVIKAQAKMKDNLAEEKGLPSMNLVAYDLKGNSKYGFDTKSMHKSMTTKIKMQQKMLELLFHPRLVKYNTNTKFDTTKK
ncbi:MAG: AsmA family protein [Salinivirgaceae bacterium]|nr:AsmA family protein [Salinivirgaceae bacterium]